MADTDKTTLQRKTILTVLDVDTTMLADRIGEKRPIVSDIINGKPRKAVKARKKLADELCGRVVKLILLDEPLEDAA